MRIGKAKDRKPSNYKFAWYPLLLSNGQIAWCEWVRVERMNRPAGLGGPTTTYHALPDNHPLNNTDI